MTKKSAAFFDIDGTFYISKSGLKTNIKLAKQYREKGNILGFATGRTYEYFKKVIKQPTKLCDYIASNHGGVILKSDGTLIEYHPIDKEIINEVTKIFKNTDISYHDIYNTVISCNKPNITKVSYKILDLEKNYDEDNIQKAKEEATELNEKVKKEFGNKVNSFRVITDRSVYVEIVSIKAEKSLAIKKIIELENISSKDVYTVGDDETDIEMVREFNGFAMEDGNDKVKDVAKTIIKDLSQVFDIINT